MTDHKIYLIYLFAILEFLYTILTTAYMFKRFENFDIAFISKVGLFIIWCVQMAVVSTVIQRLLT